MREYDYIIVGGGLAGASAVEGIRQRDGEGSILMLSEEPEPPYNRPPLSKEYLQAPEIPRELLHIKPEGWFEAEAGVTVEREQRVLSLDPSERTVISARGNDYRGERILIATGGRPRELPHAGIAMTGVHTLRRVEDAEAIRASVPSVERAVLVGAGFIGMELASSLRHHGVEVVVVEEGDRVWPRLLPRQLASSMQAYFEQRGVRFHLERRVTGLRGEGNIEGVALDDGSTLECQMAIVGIGIRPNQELAHIAGLAVTDGIVVDPYGETSHAFIYAAGDVARFPDPLFGDLTRVEHWDHARAHGRLVGANMAGDRAAYDHTSYFFSDVFDLSINAVGRMGVAQEVEIRGSLADEPLIAFGASSGVLSGILLVNAAAELDSARALLARRPEMAEVKARLGGGPEVDLARLLE